MIYENHINIPEELILILVMICFEGLRKISKLSSQFYETARSRKHLYNAEKVLQPVMSRGPWDIIEYLKYCK